MAIKYDFWDYLGKIFTLAIGVLLVVAFKAFGNLSNGNTFDFWLSLVTLVLGLWLSIWSIYRIVRMGHGGNKRCRHCGKWFADELINDVVDSSYKTTKTVSHDIRDKDFKKVGEYDQTVPATAYHGRRIWKCNNCGNTREVSYCEIY